MTSNAHAVAAGVVAPGRRTARWAGAALRAGGGQDRLLRPAERWRGAVRQERARTACRWPPPTSMPGRHRSRPARRSSSKSCRSTTSTTRAKPRSTPGVSRRSSRPLRCSCRIRAAASPCRPSMSSRKYCCCRTPACRRSASAATSSRCAFRPTFTATSNSFIKYEMATYGKKVALAATDHDYAKVWIAAFKPAWEAAGGTIVADNPDVV